MSGHSSDSMGRALGPLGRLWRRRRLSDGERATVLEQLFFEGDEFVPYLLRFGSLIALSVAIASFGLMADSGAVVVGAMLIAPLMTPILAISASTVMVWPRRQLRAILLIAAGSVSAVALAALMSLLMSTEDPLLSTEVLSRTQPTMLDLGVALAAGAAAAYVTVRTKAGGALPGVAISVALVPPLATTGLLLERGETRLASEAFLLFATNLVGIVLAASLVFIGTGFLPEARKVTRSREVQVGLAVSAILVAVVAYPLFIQGQAIIEEHNNTRQVRAEVDALLDERGSKIALKDVAIDHDADPTEITLSLAGPAREEFEVDEIAATADLFADELGEPVELRVEYILTEVRTSSSVSG